MPALGTTGLDVHPLCLGGNVFGWTADEAESFAVLDAYAAAGGNFIDTADVYSAWVPGHRGGESEALLGRWMAARGNRDAMVIATKVGQMPDAQGLGAATIDRAAQGSLERLQTDRIDLYYAHIDDASTPLEESLAAFDALVQAGSVLHLGASNHTAERLGEAAAISARDGLARYEVLQPHYNLVERDGFEGPLQELCREQDIAVVPYFGLAKGFLTGKYRAGGAPVDSPRAAAASAYLDDGGAAVLAALDTVAHHHDVPVGAVALAWLRDRDTVVAPIASARTVAQLEELLPLAGLQLSQDERDALDASVA